MKRIISLITLLLCLTCLGFAQTGLQDKVLRKECKKTIKLMEKGGWHVFASTKSIETAVTQYYEQLEAGGNEVRLVVGHATATNENMALSTARANAMNMTAGMIESNVTGATTMMMTNLNQGKEVQSGLESTNVTEVSVRQSLKGMVPALQVYRTLPDKKGKVEMQLFYLVKI